MAEVGYQPEYGARELKRQVRALLETPSKAPSKGDGDGARAGQARP